MRTYEYTGLIFLIVIIAIIAFFPKVQDGFKNSVTTDLANMNMGAAFPECQNIALLYKEFPVIHTNMVSDKMYSDIWWKYPSFGVSSYKQITNNIRYPNNPDNGTAVRAEFSNAFYKNKKNKSNYSVPLGPVPLSADKLRVGYYNTKDNLILGASPSFLPTF